MNEYRVNDVDLREFLHSFTDGDGKLPSDFEQLKREGHYLIHGDADRAFCLKEREIYLKDTMENLLAKSICFFFQHAHILCSPCEGIRQGRHNSP